MSDSSANSEHVVTFPTTELPRWLIFGDFRLDRAEKRLWRNGETLPLAPKAIELLILLVQARGRLLSKENLMAALWPSTFVEENNLTQHIVRIRKALGGEGNGATFIETIPRRGYRFTAEVVETNQPLPIDAAPVVQRRWWRSWKTGVAIAALLASAALAIHFGRPDATSRSVTVLPFRTLHAGGSESHIAAGISEGVANRLSVQRGLTVSPASPGLSADPRSAAKSMGVDAVLSGAVQVNGDTLRVTAQLFDARRGKNIWSRRFDATTTEILRIEDVIADEIASLLRPGLTSEQQARLTQPRSRDATANAEYLRGRDLLDRRVRIHESVLHFERAIARDPDFSLAWAGLAEALAYPQYFSATEPGRAAAAARKAIRLDPSVAEGHATLGFIHLFYDWNPDAAARELRQALRLKPASARFHDWYAIALMLSGHADDAIATIDRARAIDPASMDIASDAALVRLVARDFAGAERAARAALSLDPSNGTARHYLHLSLSRQGRIHEALTAVGSLHDQIPLRRALLEFQAGDPGRRDWIRTHLAGKRDLAPEGIASAYATIGDETAALESLERALDQRSFGLIFAVLDPAFDGMRHNPRFQRIMDAVGVTPPFPPPGA